MFEREGAAKRVLRVIGVECAATPKVICEISRSSLLAWGGGVALNFALNVITIDEFADGLAGIPEQSFTTEGVLGYMRSERISIESMEPYLFFSPEKYTRNLIRKTPLYDLIALCWEVGQRSTIHNHTDQRCWMGVVHGRVQVQNFRVVAQDRARGFCELAPSDHYIIDSKSPAQVDPEEPVHLVTNPSSFGSRAVTLHIYSLPFDTCEVYDIKAKRCEVVNLVNTSEYGVLKNGARAERVPLR